MSTESNRDGTNPLSGLDLDAWFADQPPGVRRWVRYCLTPAMEQLYPSTSAALALPWMEVADRVYGHLADQCIAAGGTTR
jgi:hypothetical protein